ncbi:hypothetical protein [Nocardioides panacisoli]|uniref:Uncharacterized protein n=1 Tax=Nocardioides panacisoli TaxID=627624 RepID=A0ABP7HXF9_9ACTN
MAGIEDKVHVTYVKQGLVPQYAYTHDISGSSPFEFVCAGVTGLVYRQVDDLLRYAYAQTPDNLASLGTFGDLDQQFTLNSVDQSWLSVLVPRTRQGAHYLQVVPRCVPNTVDTPDLSLARDRSRDVAWRWLDEPWAYDVPSGSSLVTTLAVMSGTPPISFYRWEPDQWEALDKSAADVVREDVRVLPIGVLPLISPHHDSIRGLRVGAGLKLTGQGLVPD